MSYLQNFFLNIINIFSFQDQVLLYNPPPLVAASSTPPIIHHDSTMYNAASLAQPVRNQQESVEQPIRTIAPPPPMHNPNCPAFSAASFPPPQQQTLVNYPSNLIPPPNLNNKEDFLGSSPHIISSTSLHNLHVAHLEFPLNIPTPEPFRDSVIACYGTIERRKPSKQSRLSYSHSCDNGLEPNSSGNNESSV